MSTVNDLNNGDLNENQHDFNDDSRHILPIVSDALDAAEKEQESRRKKLNEILERTRNINSISSNSLSSATIEATGDSFSKFPLIKLSGIDASTLAQDLLAQRRQKLQGLSDTESQFFSSSIERSNNINPNSNLSNDLMNSDFLDTGITTSHTTEENEQLFRQNPLIAISGKVIVESDLNNEMNRYKHESNFVFENNSSNSENKTNYESSNLLLIQEPSVTMLK